MNHPFPLYDAVSPRLLHDCVSIAKPSDTPPPLSSLTRERNADVEWRPNGDNRAPILRFLIQYNTSFTPDTWVEAADAKSSDNSFVVPLSPWSNYTFRVIAVNRVGPSLPSGHSEVCTTPKALPEKNPENVEGRGTEPDNLVIRWTVREPTAAGWETEPTLRGNGRGGKRDTWWSGWGWMRCEVGRQTAGCVWVVGTRLLKACCICCAFM